MTFLSLNFKAVADKEELFLVTLLGYLFCSALKTCIARCFDHTQFSI